MKSAEIQTLLKSKSTRLFQIDADQKTVIQRSTLTTLNREIQKAISSKKNVRIIVSSD
jgi:hypothetical protein